MKRDKKSYCYIWGYALVVLGVVVSFIAMVSIIIEGMDVERYSAPITFVTIGIIAIMQGKQIIEKE
jgi:hypothetical protein